MLLLLHTGLVQKSFLLGGGGRLFEGGHLFTFWAFRVGAYLLFGLSGWTLIYFLGFQGGRLFEVAAYLKVGS